MRWGKNTVHASRWCVRVRSRPRACVCVWRRVTVTVTVIDGLVMSGQRWWMPGGLWLVKPSKAAMTAPLMWMLPLCACVCGCVCAHARIFCLSPERVAPARGVLVKSHFADIYMNWGTGPFMWRVNILVTIWHSSVYSSETCGSFWLHERTYAAYRFFLYKSDGEIYIYSNFGRLPDSCWCFICRSKMHFKRILKGYLNVPATLWSELLWQLFDNQNDSSAALCPS